MKKITIAIDGYSSCGKSTMAKDLAKQIGYVYVDTGAMYRSVTLYALRHNMFMSDGSIDEARLREQMSQIRITFCFNPVAGRPDTYLNGELVEKEIRGLEVSAHVSPIAALPFVREAMVCQQQQMGREKGIVRARRRFDELREKGMEADYNDILKNVEERDYIDSHRDVSPLRKADDAIELDNSNLTIEEQRSWLFSQYEKATKM